MENSLVTQQEEIELGHASPNWRQKLTRAASDFSLESAAISDQDSSEHAEGTGIARSFKSFTADEEKVVVRKLDCHLVLFIALLYMLSFLDRSSKLTNTYERVYEGWLHSQQLNALQISEMRGLPV